MFSIKCINYLFCVYFFWKSSDLGEIKSKYPADLTYITSAIPRIKDINNSTNTILKDVQWIISQKGIKSGVYAFANTTYIDAPAGVSSWGYIEFFQHADAYVTVILYPETTQNVYYRRFILTNNTWDNNWWKTQLVEVN